jgi:hypothetical protein
MTMKKTNSQKISQKQSGKNSKPKKNTAKLKAAKIKIPKKSKPTMKGIKPYNSQNTPQNKKINVTALIETQKQLTKPDPKIILKIDSFVDRLNKELRKNKVRADATLGGSVAKGTFIKEIGRAHV